MSPKEPTTPKTTPKKRAAQMPSTLPNQETRFAWACFKNTGQNVNYDEVARLCGCSKDAARFRFYKMRSLFEDTDLLKDDEPSVTPKSQKKTPSRTPKKNKTESKDDIKELFENAEVKLEDVPQDSKLEAEDLYEA